MWKKCKIVILPANNTESFLYTNSHNMLFHNIRNTVKKNNICTPQHLYILSDDEIKEGDWECVNRIGISRNSSAIYSKQEKIIATTNSSLLIKDFDTTYKRVREYLPSIPQSFIDKYISEYNKGNKIADVMVEYVAIAISGIVPVIKDDNTINIKYNKDNWTKEEVIQLLHKYDLNGCSNSDIEFDNWIENNLND